LKLKQCELSNFGSYSHLLIDFSDIGLGLVYGPTGSGKSTLQDASCWILFGQTSKGGTVDEIRSWKASGAATKGCLEIEIGDKTIIVNRSRGKQGQNDLFWLEDDEIKRGKDLIDTQRLLEARLGVTAEEYTTASYFHEFSESASFFSAKAQDRRLLFEKLTDLSLPEKLAAKCKVTKSVAKKDLDEGQKQVTSLSSKLEQIFVAKEDAESRLKKWDISESVRLAQETAKITAWEKSREIKIQTLSEELEDLNIHGEINYDAAISEAKAGSKCTKCGAISSNSMQFIEKLLDDKLRFSKEMARFEYIVNEIDKLKAQVCPYIVTEEQNSVNPFIEQLESINSNITSITLNLENADKTCTWLELQYSSLERLYDLCASLRGELLKKAVKTIEWDTNNYLEKYFDSEIKVEFQLGGSDNLNVTLQKSGYTCTYKQLSKGQRGLLRLCFSVAVMRASANNKGQHFDNIFMDEALDGLDTTLKLKAFRLFESLALDHSSVLIIDHCEELHTLFENKYRVTIDNDESKVQIEKS